MLVDESFTPRGTAAAPSAPRQIGLTRGGPMVAGGRRQGAGGRTGGRRQLVNVYTHSLCDLKPACRFRAPGSGEADTAIKSGCTDDFSVVRPPIAFSFTLKSEEEEEEGRRAGREEEGEGGGLHDVSASRIVSAKLSRRI